VVVAYRRGSPVLPAARRGPSGRLTKSAILDSGEATGAQTRVIIDSSNGALEWSTMGSGTNIIAAPARRCANRSSTRSGRRGRKVRRARRASLHNRRAARQRVGHGRPVEAPRLADGGSNGSATVRPLATRRLQGEPGAFSEEGVLSAFVAPEAVALPTWRAVFEAVNDGTADAGVVPIERSSGAAFARSTTCLFKFDELRIAAEVTVPVRLALLAMPGQTARPGSTGLQHRPGPLDQADEFLRSRPWSVLTSYNTAGAAKSIRRRG